MSKKLEKPRFRGSRRRIRFPSPALVVAVTALLVASAGMASAAGQIRHVPTWNSRDIIDNSLTGKDIKNRSVAKKDLAASALPRRGQAGPPGTPGAAGLPGAKGDKGDRGDPAAIAYGFILSNGTVAKATSNVTSTWNAAQSWYEITIAGHTYLYSNYVTLITPANATLIPSAASALGKLIVLFRNTSGTLVQTPGGFQFATYAP
jgi:hypothetical protein